MRGLWLMALKNFATGTLNGSKRCLDVHVANTISTAQAAYAQLERRFMDTSDTQINASGGAFKEVGSTGFAAADIANTITELRIRNHTGSALVFSKGADATAAALAANELGCVHEGGEENFGVSLASGDKLWVRALENTAVNSGKVLALLMG